eukprot:746872-Hanusia_phi.AAC.1
MSCLVSDGYNTISSHISSQALDQFNETFPGQRLSGALVSILQAGGDEAIVRLMPDMPRRRLRPQPGVQRVRALGRQLRVDWRRELRFRAACRPQCGSRREEEEKKEEEEEEEEERRGGGWEGGGR